MEKQISDVIKQRIEESGDRFWAGDNISKHINPEEKDLLIEKCTLRN